MDKAVNLDDLALNESEWLRGAGPEADIVISSRIRLARNLADYPFISRATEPDRAEIEKSLRVAVEPLRDQNELMLVDVAGLPGLDRQFLIERQLISRELAESRGARSVAIDTHEKFSLMMNE